MENREIGRSIIGYTHYRRGPDKLVHIASHYSFEHPYDARWSSRCNQWFVKGKKRESKPHNGPPTCLLCIGYRPPAEWIIPEDSWQTL